MESPFVFIKEVVGDNFVGRKEELNWLSSNMLNNQNSVIIAPSRYGKTSLVRTAQLQAQKQDLTIKFCFIDLFNVRDALSFYKKFASEAVKSVAGTVDDWQLYTDEFFPTLTPRVVINDKINSVKLEFDKLTENPSECIDFFQNYAEKYDSKIVVCIEHFHNILDFEESNKFQKQLAKTMKNAGKVAYIVSGDKKNAMKEMFQTPRNPFNNFGDIFFPEPIDEKLFADYIVKLFSRSGRVIKKEQAERLCLYVKAYPYYVQLFSDIIWNNTKGFVTDQTIEISEKQLLEYCHQEFLFKIDTLSLSQINYLRAIIDGVDRFCSAESIHMYGLNSSSNVARVKSALIKKEVLEYDRYKPYFLDPVFELWLKKVYFYE